MSTWQQVGIEDQCGRSNVKSAVLGTDIYTPGGFYIITEVPLCTKFDTLANVGVRTANMPTSRYNVVPVFIGGKMYVVGGRTYSPATYFATLEIYDPATDTWATGTPMSTPRTDACGAVVNGKIYVIAGANTSGALSSVESYDPATDTWSACSPIPVAMDSACAVTVDGKIYVIGGRVSGTVPYLDTVYCYDPATDTWTLKSGKMPTGRFHAGATELFGSIVVAGGTQDNNGTANTSLKTVEIYDPKTDSWVSDNDMLKPRDRFGLVTVGMNAYACSGWIGSGTPEANGTATFYNDVQKLTETNIVKILNATTDKPMYNNGESVTVSGQASVAGATITVQLYDTNTHVAVSGTATADANGNFSVTLATTAVQAGSCRVDVTI